MKVLLVVHGWPPLSVGGTGLVVGGLARALQELGDDVHIVHPGASAEPLTPGVHFHPLRRPPARRWASAWSRRSPELDQLLDQQRFDVVHIHHLSGLPLTLPRQARATGARVVWTLHDYAIPCARGQLVNAQDHLCKGPSVDRCTPCLRPFLRTHLRRRTRVAQRLRLAEDALAAAHVRVAPSRDLARRITAITGHRVDPIDLPLLRPVSPAPPAEAGPVRFLFCSAVIPTKGPDRLIRAFRRLPTGSATLTIAGPTPRFPGRPDYAADLRKQAASTRGIAWKGPVQHDEVPNLLHQHDVLVLPSTWPENSPLIVREASAAGLHTIVGAVGGAAELDPLARTVAPDREDDLLDALLEAVHRGRARRPPLTWPTPHQHAKHHRDTHYRPPT